MYLSVKSVKPLDGYKLLLKFENNEEKVFDVSPYLDLGKFSELKDVSLFNSWIWIQSFCIKKVLCFIKTHNNRIHSNKQGRAAITFAKFEENVAFANARFPACR
jgi:hypothetical protein